jgi:hypothetical protein
VTGISPFFLSHGYHLEPLQLSESPRQENTRTPIQKANAIVQKLKDANDWIQAEMANAQQEHERQANKHRNPSPAYKVGDKVWLDLRNISTDRQSKKLDDRSALFNVTQIVGPLSFRLDTPPGIHDVFHASKLRPAANDPFPSQKLQDDYQPPAIISESGEPEWEVEAILDERKKGRQQQYKVKWKGYKRPTWEPATALADTAALEVYLTN